jgi:transcriptional regulator GlxA family with amidase domain
VKAITGKSPVDLLRKARLTRASQLLVETSASVSEIAYQVGFTSPSYFTKCFKDEYGKVPGDARS